MFTTGEATNTCWDEPCSFGDGRNATNSLEPGCSFCSPFCGWGKAMVVMKRESPTVKWSTERRTDGVQMKSCSVTYAFSEQKKRRRVSATRPFRVFQNAGPHLSVRASHAVGSSPAMIPSNCTRYLVRESLSSVSLTARF